MRISRLVLIVHAAATWGMAGIVWFVQGVHYPLLAAVGEASFSAYETANVRLTPWVVGPPMVVEAVSGLFLLWRRPAGVRSLQAWLGVLLLLVIWISTDLAQVPLHRTLQRGFLPDAHALLVASNWVRTAAWTLRGGLAAWMLGGAMGAAGERRAE